MVLTTILRWIKLAFFIFVWMLIANAFSPAGSLGIAIIFGPILAVVLSAIVMFVELFIPHGISILSIYVVIAVLNLALGNILGFAFGIIGGFVLWGADYFTEAYSGI